MTLFIASHRARKLLIQRILAWPPLFSRASLSRRLPFPAQAQGVVSAPLSLAAARARPGAVLQQYRTPHSMHPLEPPSHCRVKAVEP